jgi:hypothetical protein
MRNESKAAAAVGRVGVWCVLAACVLMALAAVRRVFPW